MLCAVTQTGVIDVSTVSGPFDKTKSDGKQAWEARMAQRQGKRLIVLVGLEVIITKGLVICTCVAAYKM